MKKFTIIIAALALMGVSSASAQGIKLGGKLGKAVEAGADLAKAATLTDAEVAELCREAIEWMDENNPVADESTEWGARLKRLTDGITEVNGIPVNFKVYHVIDINAFACGDGSIRVFSSLMDIMDDEELVGIIGHELGHIANGDVRDAIRTAYAASGALKAASAAGGKAGKFADSDWGALTESFMNSKFSRTQENAADDYGFQFAIDRGYSPYAMAKSLERLVEISSGSNSNLIDKMFQSHPDSDKRAKRMREKADQK